MSFWTLTGFEQQKMVLFLLKAHLQRLERHEIRHSKCKWILWLLVCQDRGYAQYKSPTDSLPQTRHLHEVMFYLHAFFHKQFCWDHTRSDKNLIHVSHNPCCDMYGSGNTLWSCQLKVVTAALCTVHKEALEMLIKYKYIKCNIFNCLILTHCHN